MECDDSVTIDRGLHLAWFCIILHVHGAEVKEIHCTVSRSILIIPKQYLCWKDEPYILNCYSMYRRVNYHAGRYSCQLSVLRSRAGEQCCQGALRQSDSQQNDQSEYSSIQHNGA